MWRKWKLILVLFGLTAAVAGAALTRDRWMAWLRPSPATASKPPKAKPPSGDVQVFDLSPEARHNLGLVVKPLKLASYWRTIEVPGVMNDRPGRSDRGVTSPAVAVVAEIHAHPGDTVKPGDSLFSLSISSEYLQNAQSELFKATRELELVVTQQERLKGLAESGAVPAARLIEVENQLQRQKAIIQSSRQDLLTRGFSAAQIDGVAGGTFVSTIEVAAPSPATESPSEPGVEPALLTLDDPDGGGPIYEVEELNVELGEQVQAGQVLCLLANHSVLYIEGHAFKQDAPFLERAAQKNWPIQVEFAEDEATGWPTLEQSFTIRHLANSVDPLTRTFDFYIRLVNQSRRYEKEGNTFVVWRFRPGQRVRLHIPVEEFQEVFVLPTEGVAREGPEAFVFRQNGDLFNRKRVRILHEDRLNTVVANEGQIVSGMYVAQNGAASLNRVLKAQAASGVPAGVHVHADGTTHGAH